ncbi:hypothetical protein OV450_4674 [Actinobacteria bacterium OV450]|nr:hypothetical protein OV450_4674 [Actinobacteria bacterium OV450]
MDQKIVSSCADKSGARGALGLPTVVLMVVFLMMAAGLRVLGEPIPQIFELLGGATGIGVAAVVTLAGGRRPLRWVLRAIQAGS